MSTLGKHRFPAMERFTDKFVTAEVPLEVEPRPHKRIRQQEEEETHGAHHQPSGHGELLTCETKCNSSSPLQIIWQISSAEVRARQLPPSPDQ